MGRGDKKTAKGKRTIGSYGNTRKKKVAVVAVAKTEKPVKAAKVVSEKVVKEKKAAAPKKETTKKVVEKEA